MRGKQRSVNPNSEAAARHRSRTTGPTDCRSRISNVSLFLVLWEIETSNPKSDMVVLMSDLKSDVVHWYFRLEVRCVATVRLIPKIEWKEKWGFLVCIRKGGKKDIRERHSVDLVGRESDFPSKISCVLRIPKLVVSRY